ncbi:hypothetical protein BDF19DRAFT_433789 [Syncephalis fuscata]|nr:hypothetical protein BDF19DRAFT_433789 [Syncephalis fuscata]
MLYWVYTVKITLYALLFAVDYCRSILKQSTQWLWQHIANTATVYSCYTHTVILILKVLLL